MAFKPRAGSSGMRFTEAAALLTLLMATLAGCASPAATADAAAPATGPTGPGADASASAGTSGVPASPAAASAAPAPEPVVLSGPIQAFAEGCIIVAHNADATPMVATRAEVPEAAWGRTYTGPATDDATLNAGDLCAIWVLADGTQVAGGDAVPAQTVSVYVTGEANAQGTWHLTVG